VAWRQISVVTGSASVRALFVAGAAMFLLGACSSDMGAIVDTMRAAVRRDAGTEGVRLNPNLRYLRVTIDGRVAFVARGGVEQHPQGPIESYFSAEREVLRLQNGRLVAAVGTTTEWRRVSLPDLPAWSVLAKAGKPVQWERVRDVMPGYRYGVRDALVLRVVPPPSRTELREVDPRSLTWFEERSEAGGRSGLVTVVRGDSGGDALPPARYAVEIRDGSETVVYGEQCLAPGWCFAWQRWQVKP
jgi:hypothetical protein